MGTLLLFLFYGVAPCLLKRYHKQQTRNVQNIQNVISNKLFRQTLHNPGSAWLKRRTRGQAQQARRQQSVKKWSQRCSPSRCCPPRTVHLWQRTWAITQLPPASWLGLPLSPSSLEHCALCQPEEESGFHLLEC